MKMTTLKFITLPGERGRQNLHTTRLVSKHFRNLFKHICSTHHWPCSKSKFNLKSDRVNLVDLVSPSDTVQTGTERLTRLGNSNLLRLPMAVEFRNVPEKGGSYISETSALWWFLSDSLQSNTSVSGARRSENNPSG